MRAETELRAFRVALVAAQLVTLASCWPLWSATRQTPLLPTIEALAGVSFGPLLVLSALAVLHGSRAAWALHLGTLALAMLGDAHRLQPAPISIAMLLAACTGPRAALDRALVQASLGALWLAAGAGKLLARGAFETDVAPAFGATLGAPLLWLVPWAELALGVLVLAGPTRRLASGLGALLHTGILAALIEIDHNRGVWAWNLVLVLVCLASARTADDVTATSQDDTTRGEASAPRDDRSIARSPLALAILAWPLLYPLGLAPASTAFFVYSGLEPVTLVCDRDERCTLDREIHRSLRELEVPVPASVALLEASFRADCRPGERWLARERRGREEILAEARCDERQPR